MMAGDIFIVLTSIIVGCMGLAMSLPYAGQLAQAKGENWCFVCPISH